MSIDPPRPMVIMNEEELVIIDDEKVDEFKIYLII